MGEIRICQIHSDYLTYLRQFDSRVSLDYSGTRKFVGILLDVNGKKYYAPMSSPKPKHAVISNKLPDIYKIDNGRLGVINLNNMVPVPDEAIIIIDIDNEPNIKYKTLLNNQMRIIKADSDKIKRKARVLYSLVNRPEHQLMSKRCCQYSLLETKCTDYKKPQPDNSIEQIS